MDYVTGLQINILDGVCLAVLLGFLYLGYRKGLIRMAFDLVGYMLSVYIASRSYPVVGDFLRNYTPLYQNIKTKLIQSLGLGDIIQAHIQKGEAAVFESLPLPSSIVERLADNNLPSVYQLLRVDGLEDYIGGFLANMVTNMIAAIIVFALVSVAMRVLVAALDIISRLPVINKFNKGGGLLAGLAMGCLTIWVLLLVYSVFFVSTNATHGNLLEGSFIANLFNIQNSLLSPFMKGI